MIYNVLNYDFNKIINVKCLHDTRSHKRRIYKNVMCAFDIETSRIKEIEQSFMYIWQFGIMYLEDCHIDVIIGRTWEEYELLLKKLESDDTNGRYLIFVHNLSYEFQFLREVYKFEPEEVMAVKSRKILKLDMRDKFEYRCSYLQTNMSLDQLTRKMNVKHRKLSGEKFNYDKLRTASTPLTKFELEYAIIDVVGLLESMYKRMISDGDNLYTLPLTSTGYVRREAKKELFAWAKRNKRIFPSIDVYDELEEAFRGGDTHANRYYANRTLHFVASYDRSSSYPDVIVNCYFPMTPFVFVGGLTESEYEFKQNRGKALISRFAFTNLRQKDEFYGAPYISISKCRNINSAVKDNGRVLSANYLETTLTDIDFDIIKKEYVWDSMEILDVYESKYGKLPTKIIDLVIKYYKNKTELKGVEEQEEFYMKQKELLNAIYGMMVQCPTKENLIFLENHEKLFSIDDVSRETLLEKFNQKAFLPYQWGVWVTAWARFRLKEMIDIAGDCFVYSDTDSVKFLASTKAEYDRIKKAIYDYNKLRIDESTKNGAYAKDPKGIVHYMGVYESEGVYLKFATMGAKKYCYVDKKGLHCTISGVNKKKAPKELGNIGRFKEGFVFKEAGGTESIYNDEPYGVYEIDGEEIYIGINMVVKPSEYTLGLASEYENLLNDIFIHKDFEKYIDNMYKL